VGEETFDLRGGEVEPFSLQQRPASEDQTWRSGAKRADLGELPSLSTIVIGFLLLLLGLAFGRHLGMASLYDATYRSLQNEIYGLTEFAAVQTMAAQDMADLRQKLAAARAALDKKPGGGAVSEALGEAMARLEELEAEYQRRRAAVREDIVRFSKGRRTLVQRLDGLRRDQKQTQAFVATLYLARLARDLNRLEADDYAALAPETKRSLRDAIERLLQFSPQSKSDIQTLFPGLLNAVYATSDSSPTGVKPSTEAKTK
jgi:hypothetical protein